MARKLAALGSVLPGVASALVDRPNSPAPFIALPIGGRLGAACLLLAITLGSASCGFPLFRKSPKVYVPPPAQPKPAAAEVVPVIPPPEIPTQRGEDSASSLPPASPEPPAYPVQFPKASPPAAPAKRPPVATVPKPVPPPATGPESPVATTPPPRLGQIFTAKQIREYNRSLDDSLNRVKKTLAVVERRNLNAEQREIAGRIRTFQRQAEDARNQDLVTAVSLARRADLLAQDLLARLN